MDKTKVLKALTKDWQNTKQIAEKIKAGSQNIIGVLYELLLDDKKVERMKMPKGVNGFMLYWRLKK